ncbi:MAG: 23S rRNA (uracil(1939)-C(5))-methyltransferase RlmD [Oscillospiraceae bacterium]
MLNKNDKITLTIEGITTDGNGVARADGYAIFVPKTCVGDVVEILVVKPLKNYAFGKALNIITPSEDRIENKCAAFGKCGGCSFRHVSYEAECKYKKDFVQSNMKKLGGIDVPCKDTLPSPKVDRYRNKALYPVREENGELVVGFFAKRSHNVIPCENCLLHPDFYEKILLTVKDFMIKYKIPAYNEESGEGLVRHIFIRHGEVSKEVMVCLIINGKKIPNESELVTSLLAVNPSIKSIVLNVNTTRNNVIMGDKCRTISGNDYITDVLCGVKIAISPMSFYQINHDQTEVLYSKAKELLSPTGCETVLDLYCGTGTIGLSLAKDIKNLIGAEIIEDAVSDARKNAEINGIDNARFICGDAGKVAKQLASENIRPDAIIVDPPRKGISDDVIEAICQMQPQKLIMISCNSATAARDCKLLAEKGYGVESIQGVDMFPRTVHVECIVLMTRTEQ